MTSLGQPVTSRRESSRADMNLYGRLWRLALGGDAARAEVSRTTWAQSGNIGTISVLREAAGVVTALEPAVALTSASPVARIDGLEGVDALVFTSVAPVNAVVELVGVVVRGRD